MVNNSRYHLPNGTNVNQVPRADSFGDRLQAAATAARQRWSPALLSPKEARAIRQAFASPKPWNGYRLRAQAIGRYVERTLRQQFQNVQWNRQGVDVRVPGQQMAYEILSGTPYNIRLHIGRMPNEFFRLITF